MRLIEYQNEAKTTALYAAEFRVTYPALGLANEAGEVLGKLKKILRDDGGRLSDEKQVALLEELGDVLWYIAILASDLGIEFKRTVLTPADPVDEIDIDDIIVEAANLQLLASVLTHSVLVDKFVIKSDIASAEVMTTYTEATNGLMISLARTITLCGSTWSIVAKMNLEKLASRAKRGVIGGSGDKR